VTTTEKLATVDVFVIVGFLLFTSVFWRQKGHYDL